MPKYTDRTSTAAPATIELRPTLKKSQPILPNNLPCEDVQQMRMVNTESEKDFESELAQCHLRKGLGQVYRITAKLVVLVNWQS